MKESIFRFPYYDINSKRGIYFEDSIFFDEKVYHPNSLGNILKDNIIWIGPLKLLGLETENELSFVDSQGITRYYVCSDLFNTSFLEIFSILFKGCSFVIQVDTKEYIVNRIHKV